MSYLGVTVTFVLIVITYYLYNVAKNARMIRFFAKFPSPPTILFFGNGLENRTPARFFENVHKYRLTCGPAFSIRIGPFRRMLFISDHEWVKFLLTSNKVMNKMENYRFLERWLGEGLLMSPGDRKWELHRKMLTPAFHFKILENFVEVFEAAGNTLVKKLKEKGNQKSFDVHHYVTLCTLDIICEIVPNLEIIFRGKNNDLYNILQDLSNLYSMSYNTKSRFMILATKESAMGTSVHAQENEESEYVHSVKEMCRIIVERTLNPLKSSSLLYPLTRDYYAEKKSLKILGDYTNSVIVNRRKELMKTKTKNQENGTGDLTKQRKVFLDLLLESDSNDIYMSDEEIRQEVDTFLFAGHDTTAIAISLILYCITNHQDVQDLVLDEQRAIFGSEKNPVVTYANLLQMNYLEQVIKETLRLYPPVPFYGRSCTTDVEFNGITIPKGVNLAIFVPGLHEDPEYWPNPKEFDPKRFETDDGRSPYTFIPFSAGPRNCIGRKFAYLEMKHVVSNIVRHFKLLPAVPAHKLVLAPETVQKSQTGVKIGFEERV